MTKKRPFNVSDFLGKMDGGRTVQMFRKDEKVFAQGDPADAVFYIHEGKLKVSVVSQQGKEAVVASRSSQKCSWHTASKWLAGQAAFAEKVAAAVRQR